MPHPHQPTPEAARARYLRHRNSDQDNGYLSFLWQPRAALRRFAPNAQRVLDYGCGPTAVLVRLLAENGYEAVGYDPLFASDTPLSPPYDAILAVETFEHFAQPRQEIEHIVEWLAPNGILIVMTLLHEGPDRLANWWYIRDVTHVTFYSHRTFQWLCATFGFTMIYSDEYRLAVFQRPAQPVKPG